MGKIFKISRPAVYALYLNFFSKELSGNVVGDQPIVEEIPEDRLDSGSEVAVTSGVIDLDSVELIGE